MFVLGSYRTSGGLYRTLRHLQCASINIFAPITEAESQSVMQSVTDHMHVSEAKGTCMRKELVGALSPCKLSIWTDHAESRKQISDAVDHRSTCIVIGSREDLIESHGSQ